MNMDKWIALIRERMEELDVSQEWLAERVGVSQGSVGHWLRKRRQPKVESMNRTFVELGMPHYQVSLQLHVTGQIGELPVRYAVGDDDEPQLKYIVCFRYPLLAWEALEGDVRAAAFEHYEQTEYRAEGHAYWLTVNNDAMSASSGRSVAEGMRILVDDGVPVEPGRLVIARQPGRSAIFRQLAEEGGERYLKALNGSYPAQVCEEGCEFLGVVVRVHGVV
ncbi:LexA family transcriptional regulator [Pseudomonas entomophila]|uniref:LexA family transcriptional regulator n=1 Tax=Pseudomonas entomophila TaxID=312306 RepID=UPI0023D84993|nr:LexA family transcriptional regulator [Pseudomonas entomophila]MDF0730930.1 LexA family transcriptional regulator [Pseudomonas entomophila]